MRRRTAIVTIVGSIFIALILVVVFSVGLHLALSGGSSSGLPGHSYGGASASFLRDLHDNRVSNVEINVNDSTMKVLLKTGSVYSVAFPDTSQLTAELAQHPDVIVTSNAPSSGWPSALWLFVPGLLIVLVLSFVIFVALRRWLREPSEPADGLFARLADLQGRVERLEKQSVPPPGDE